MLGRLSIFTRGAGIAQRFVLANRVPSVILARMCSSEKHPSPSPPDPAAGGYMGQRRSLKKEQSYLWSKRNASAETFAEHVMRDVVPRTFKFNRPTTALLMVCRATGRANRNESSSRFLSKVSACGYIMLVLISLA